MLKVNNPNGRAAGPVGGRNDEDSISVLQHALVMAVIGLINLVISKDALV